MYDVVPKNAATPMGKRTAELSTNVENAAIGYLLACKHKIQKLLINLVHSKQDSVDQL